MSPVPMPVPWGAGGVGTSLPPWPPANGLTTINCPRNATVFTVNASTHIDAPVDIIWNVLRNTTAFPEWNTFTPSATITLQPLSDQLPKDEQGKSIVHGAIITLQGLKPIDFLNLGAKFTYVTVLDPRAPMNTTPAFEQVSDFSTPQNKSTYVPADILRNDGSFYPDLNRVYRIAWITDPDSAIVKAGLFSERFNEIIPLDDCGGEKKGCEYRTWESEGGPPAQTVKALYQSLLQEDFEIWARDLKKESEKKATRYRKGGGHPSAGA